MNKETLVKRVEKMVKDDLFPISNGNFSEANIEDIDLFMRDIENIVNLGFSISLRGDGGSNWWLETTYYSGKLKKIVIIDTDTTILAENPEEMVDFLLKTSEEVKDFEERIVFLEDRSETIR